MKTKRPLRMIAICLCVALCAPPRPAKATSLGTDVVLVAVAIGVVAAGIGVGIYFAVRKPRPVRGCVVNGQDGLALRTESDQQTLRLTGITSDIKPGERVKVVGHKKKNPNAPGTRDFLVEKLSKDYGPCTVPAAK